MMPFHRNLIGPVLFVGLRSNDTNSSDLAGRNLSSDSPKSDPPAQACGDCNHRKCNGSRVHFCAYKTNHRNYGRHNLKIESSNNENRRCHHMKSRTKCIKLIKFRQSNRPASNQLKCDPLHCLIYGHLWCSSARASVPRNISKSIFRNIPSGSRIRRGDRCDHCRHNSNGADFERKLGFERCWACNRPNRQMNGRTPHKSCPLNDQNVNKQNPVATSNCDNLGTSPKAGLRNLPDASKDDSEDLNCKGRDFLNGTTSGINNGNAKIERRSFTQCNADKERNHSDNSTRLRTSFRDSVSLHRNSVLNSHCDLRNRPATLTDYLEDDGKRTGQCHSNRMNRISYTTETHRGNKPGLCSTRPSTHLSEVKRKENLDQKEVTAAEERWSMEDGWRSKDGLQSFEQVSMDDRTKDYAEGHWNGRAKDRAPTRCIQWRTFDKKDGKTVDQQSHLNYLEDKERNETHLMNPAEQVIERRTVKQVERLNNQTKNQFKYLAADRRKRDPFQMHLFTNSTSDQNRISDQKSREHEFQFEHSDLNEQNAVSALNCDICDHQIRQEIQEIQEIQETQCKAVRSTCRAVRHPLDHRTASERKATHQFHSEIPYQVPSHKIHKVRHHQPKANNSRPKSPDSLLGTVRRFLLLLVIICPHLSANESNRRIFRNQTAANFLPDVNVPARSNLMADRSLPFNIRDSLTPTAGYNDTAGDVHQINSINSFDSLDLLNSPGTFKSMNSIDSLNSISTISLDDVTPTLFNSLFGGNSTSDGRPAKTTTNYPTYLNYQSALESYQNQLALEANSINETNFTSSLYLKDKWFLRFFPDKYVDTRMELSEFLFRLFGVFICSILLCLTLFGNVLTITVVLRFNRMKTVTNILLAR